MNDKPPTRTDKIIDRIKNHRFAAFFIVGCIGVIAAGNLLDVAEKIRKLFGGNSSTSSEHLPSTLTAPSRNAESDQQSRASIVSGGNFSPVTWEQFSSQMYAAFNPKTTRLQQDEFLNSQRGKRVIWTGTVSEVFSPGPFSGPDVFISGAHSTIAIFHFRSVDVPILQGINRNDVLEISGVVTNWDAEKVQLDDSSIVRVIEDVDQSFKAGQPNSHVIG